MAQTNAVPALTIPSSASTVGPTQQSRAVTPARSPMRAHGGEATSALTAVGSLGHGASIAHDLACVM